MARLFQLSCRSVSGRARISGLIGSPLLRPVRLLAPLDGSDRALPQPRGLLHPGFQRVSLLSRCWISLRQSLDLLSVGLSPTGIAASFAAPDPYKRFNAYGSHLG